MNDTEITEIHLRKSTVIIRIIWCIVAWLVAARAIFVFMNVENTNDVLLFFFIIFPIFSIFGIPFYLYFNIKRLKTIKPFFILSKEKIKILGIDNEYREYSWSEITAIKYIETRQGGSIVRINTLSIKGKKRYSYSNLSNFAIYNSKTQKHKLSFFRFHINRSELYRLLCKYKNESELIN